MRKPGRACDQTFAPRGVDQNKHALTTTARSDGETSHEAHRVKQQNEKQVNNTAFDTQKEANKGKSESEQGRVREAWSGPFEN